MLALMQVYRGSRWNRMSTEELLPGDLVSIGKRLLLPYLLVLKLFVHVARSF